MPTRTAPAEVDEAIQTLATGPREQQGDAFACLNKATAGKVAWADSAWKKVVPLLEHKDNRVRSIAGQTLCNLASGAKTASVLRDLDKLEAITHDERFVTARHVLQSIWKVGVVDKKLRKSLVQRFANRYKTCTKEKNCKLVRYDILVAMRELFDATGDEAVKSTAMELIPLEVDPKYRKKYSGAWRGA